MLTFKNATSGILAHYKASSTKVLLLQESIVPYRVPVYNIIANYVALTIGYTKKNAQTKDISYKTIKLPYKKVGNIYWIKKRFFKLCSGFDVVIFMSDLHYPQYCMLPFAKRKFKIISWSIGMRASYTKRYDVTREKDLMDQVFGTILKKSDANIFYMQAPLSFWRGTLDENKIFVAHNTVEVAINPVKTNYVKDRILFVGTLYREKKIYELIEAYIAAKSASDKEEFPKMDIIGDGDEKIELERFIEEKSMVDYIQMHGSIYDEKELASYFSAALICVSPDQAGLSILKSMGYGVPFVTRQDAITGGERLNIINGENGILYKNQDELMAVISDVAGNPEKYLQMGENAKKYYFNNTTPAHMAKGVLDAIAFVTMK